MGLRLDVRDSIADSALERITSKSVPRVEPTIEDMSIGSLSEEMFEVGYGTTIGVELRVLCRRAFRMQWREPTSSVVLVAGYLFVCLFGGTVRLWFGCVFTSHRSSCGTGTSFVRVGQVFLRLVSLRTKHTCTLAIVLVMHGC